LPTEELTADAPVFVDLAGFRIACRLLALLESKLATEIAQEDELGWEAAPEVLPILVSFNRQGDITNVRWLLPSARRRGRGRRHGSGRATGVRRTVRARARSPGSSSDDDPEPEQHVVGLLAAVSARLWARIRRREAKWRAAT
jgi:hypothetical protein